MIEVGLTPNLTDDVVQNQGNLGSVLRIIKSFLGFDDALDQVITVFIVATECFAEKARGFIIVNRRTDTEDLIKEVGSIELTIEE